MTSPGSEPRFVSIDEVLFYHQIGIDEFGGEPGVRDFELLESAVAQPSIGTVAGYLHRFPFEMAAAYAFHLEKNHPFHDGNKRAAWSTMRAFLEKNGYVIRVPYVEEVRVTVGVSSGNIDKQVFAE